MVTQKTTCVYSGDISKLQIFWRHDTDKSGLHENGNSKHRYQDIQQ